MSSLPIAHFNADIIAIIAAYNEGDVIYHVIGDLIENGISVYLIDNQSTDNTVEEASRWLGKGLFKIERFPDSTGSAQGADRLYFWNELLKRKEELACQLDAAWFIHADADEFRECIWERMSLADGIRLVDQLGYNAIDFEVLNFRPVDDGFVPGGDVRKYLTGYEPPGRYDTLQIKAWKKQVHRVDLAQTGGHEARFVDRRVFPFRFPMRHYPIRSAHHGLQKVYRDRLPRFTREERDAGWHVQYDGFRNDVADFLWQPADLIQYHPSRVRGEIVTQAHRRLQVAAQDGMATNQVAEPVSSGWEITAEELCGQLNNDAFFVRFYNLASLLQNAGRRELARQMFETAADLVSALDPELAGKARYKLALLSEDGSDQVQSLIACLALFPGHKAARAMLAGLSGR